MTQETGSAVFDAAPGRRIAGYEVEAQIGRGGMAIVYRARDVSLDRIVALKILAPQLAQDESFRRRFIRESRSAAAVDHPHIIPVFDAGESDGALFIAMRYVPTGDVRALLDATGPLPAARAVSIIGQAASALDAAHARGLVHRDVKPANMLLARSADGESDHVYLSDFGLSKQSLAPTGLTATGQFLGTLDYVAPEQIEGRPVDGRADLYALACAMFEMLTGTPPFRRAENIALMWAQLSEPPPPIRERRPDLPPAVDQVVAKALAKAPDERFAGCGEFATALRAACLSPAPSPTAAGRPAAGQGPVRAPAELAGPGLAGPGAAGAPWPAGHPSVPPGDLPGPDSGLPSSWFRDPAGGGPAQRPPDPRWTGLPSAPPPADPTARPVPPGAYQPGRAPGPPARPPARHRGLAITLLAAGIIVVLVLVGVAIRLKHRDDAAGATGRTTPPASAPASAPGATAASSPAAPVALAPARLVRVYYQLLNEHRYLAAWELGGKNGGSSSYSAYVAGYAGTANSSLQVLAVSGDVVTARLTATQSGGGVKVYQGTYTVRDGRITHFNVTRTA